MTQQPVCEIHQQILLGIYEGSKNAVKRARETETMLVIGNNQIIDPNSVKI